MIKVNSNPIYLLFLTFLSTVLFFGCQKDELRQFTTDLAINQRIVQLADSAASTKIQIYAEDNWTIETQAKDSVWLTVPVNSGSGKKLIDISVTSNAGNLPRAQTLFIKSGNITDSVSIQQKGLVPTLAIVDEELKAIAGGGTMRTAINTNIPFELMKVEKTTLADGDLDWVTDLNIEEGYLYLKVAASTQPSIRQGKLMFSYLDALNVLVKDSIMISQQVKGAYENAKPVSFDEVRLKGEGEIMEDIYIEGIIINDKGGNNVALNRNAAANKHTIDRTPTSVTAYIQSLDGRQAFKIETATAGDNIFDRNQKVKLWLKGSKLNKHSAPEFITISGVQSLQVMEQNALATQLQPRERFMSELTDRDLFTYVKLKDVEISVPSGAYSNINEGYVNRASVYPLNLRDIRGNSLYALFNVDVPYRRDGRRVPQGSGNFAGILVYEEIERYGTQIGRYAIRPQHETDITLQENRESGFSKVHLEWSRFKDEHESSPTAAQNPLTPDIGTGKIYRSGYDPLNFTAASGIYKTGDFNGLLQEPTTVKGAVANGGWGARNWWNEDKNRGEAWVVEMSTSGISKQLSLQVEGNVDVGGPRNFVVEWNTNSDMDDSNWKHVADFTFQDITQWSNTLISQVPGYKVVNINLPVDLLNKSKVFVRLKVKDKAAGTLTNPVGGTLVNSANCRLGHLSIKYNK